MVTPDRRRVAVAVLVDRFGVSERRACRVVGQHRSTQRRPKAEPGDGELKLRVRLREIARAHPRWGWRKAHDIARREGLVVNAKRTRALWRDEGLQRPPQRRCKRRRLSDGTAARLRAEYPNHVWALDFQFDETATHRRLKLLNVVDEYTRECLAIEVARSIDADGVVEVVSRLVAERGAPTHLRMDNGPELAAWALRDWCRIWGTHSSYIEPGSPWENPFVESFNGRLRDECLNIEDFGDLQEAAIVIEDWRIEYNSYRPHRALGGLTPDEYAQQWTDNKQNHP
jgi:transposase InsO family protein